MALAGAAFLALLAASAAAEFRQVTKVDPAVAARVLAAPKSEDRPEMLADGEVTVGRSRVREAYLIGPTERYRHAILGDAVEASGFRVVTPGWQIMEHMLPTDSVFEDRRVRLWDVDGDGVAEAVVIRSYLDRGAALAVYRIGQDRIAPLAETPALGIPNRWLNPIGVADFDGDGRLEVALVTTPHIGGTLKLYRLTSGRLVEVHQRFGFSNHRIGSRELDLSAVLDFNGDGIMDIAVPDASRTRLRVVTFAGGKYGVLAESVHDSEIVSRIALHDADGNGRPDLVYRLEDGTTIAASR